jgi:hypothetical protein
MLKSALPLALLALSAQAHAFPPCPQQPIEMVSSSHSTPPPQPVTPPWFLTGFMLEGNQTVINAIAPHGHIFHSKCRPGDELPVLSANPGASYLGAAMHRAPSGGYGLIVLPDIRAHDPGRTLTYSLSFAVDSSPLAQNGDWFDVAELALSWANPLSTIRPHDIASVYRVRKLRTSNGVPVLQVIASRRTSPDEPALPTLAYDEVVATIALDQHTDAAPIKLRWSQRRRALTGSGDEFIPDPYLLDSVGQPAAMMAGDAATGASTQGEGSTVRVSTVDTVIAVIGTTGQTLFQQTLADQWASDQSMGLLDYNTGPQSMAYYEQHRPRIDQMKLEADTH